MCIRIIKRKTGEFFIAFHDRINGAINNLKRNGCFVIDVQYFNDVDNEAVAIKYYPPLIDVVVHEKYNR